MINRPNGGHFETHIPGSEYLEGIGDTCVWFGVGGVESEKIGFELYQFWRNMGKVQYVSVFWLWWCGWCWGGIGDLGQCLGGLGVCVASLDSSVDGFVVLV